MNGNCDTKVKQILDAIEYGKLLPADTEKRLLDMIEREINKEDTAADMGLISIAQDLLFELHNLSCERTEESERRLDQLRKRISTTVAKREAYGNAMRHVIKIGAAVAVFVLLVVGICFPVQWTWFESWSTPDEQQRVVQLHAVALDLIVRAIAENDSTGFYIVSDVDALDEHLGFAVDIPSVLGECWNYEEGYVQYFPDSIDVVVRFSHRDGLEKSLMAHIVFYTDSEYAWFVFEQSREGKEIQTNGHRIYVTSNLDRASAVWHMGTTVLQLSGDVTQEEVVGLIIDLIGE